MAAVGRGFAQLLRRFNGQQALRAPHKLPKPTVLPFYSTDDATGLEEQDIIAACLEPKNKFRILSLDGGGIRGILTIVLLQRIQQEIPDFLSKVDFIAGTSTGGLVALLLAAGYSPKQCEDMYAWAGPQIFESSVMRKYNPFVSRYSDKPKERLMQEFFGDRQMKDLMRMAAVTSFRLDGKKSLTHTFFNREGWRPAIFSNMPHAAGFVEPDLDLYVWDAAMRTSAAPTYFPIYKGYCDGGIVANNPSALAYTKACAHFPSITPQNCVVLSLGAGYFPQHVNLLHAADGPLASGSTDWGLRHWSPVLINLLLEGDTVTVEMMMQYMLGQLGHYHRFDPRLPYEMALDDVSKIDELSALGRTCDMTETFNFVKKRFMVETEEEEAEELERKNSDAWLRVATNW